MKWQSKHRCLQRHGFIFGWIVVLLLTSSCSTTPKNNQNLTVINTPNLQGVSNLHLANFYQEDSAVWIGGYGDYLYFCKQDSGDTHNQTSFDHWLCMVQDGEIQKVLNLTQRSDEYRVLGLVDSRFYYIQSIHKSFDAVFCYDLETNTDYPLFQSSEYTFYKKDYIVSTDGTLYLAAYSPGSEIQFLKIKDTQVLGFQAQRPAFFLNDESYWIEFGGTASRVIYSSNTKEEELLPYDHYSALIPCNEMLIVHNENSSEIVYQITQGGQATVLFSIPCLKSVSAMNILGNDVYVSFLRYEKYTESGLMSGITMERYANDTLEGTYRISLSDGNAVKICDQVFLGLYNVDDTGIFACDADANVYKIDPNGSVTIILCTELQ